METKKSKDKQATTQALEYLRKIAARKKCLCKACGNTHIKRLKGNRK